MRGRLIVVEGIDCTGKTTMIKKALETSDHNLVYSKGIGSSSVLGRFARRFPCTLFFSIELLFNILKARYNLLKGKTVLQDRYDISISSYIPLSKRWYNKIILRLLRAFIIKPDAIVYLHLPLKEHINRLKKKAKKYELILARNPNLILLREEEYKKSFEESIFNKDGFFKKFEELDFSFQLSFASAKNSLKNINKTQKNFIWIGIRKLSGEFLKE